MHLHWRISSSSSRSNETAPTLCQIQLQNNGRSGLYWPRMVTLHFFSNSRPKTRWVVVHIHRENIRSLSTVRDTDEVSRSSLPWTHRILSLCAPLLTGTARKRVCTPMIPSVLSSIQF